MPRKQAVIDGFGTIDGGESPLVIDVKNPYIDENNPSRLIIESGIRIVNQTSLVKTGVGALHLNGPVNRYHELGSLVVDKGILAMGSANISVTAPISIGPGATFLVQFYSFEQLRTQRITKAGGGLADLRLRGSKTEEAHFGFIKTTSAGAAIQGLNSLTIENKATIDFGNRATETPLILYIDQLILEGPDALLRIREWASGASYLLVRKEWGDARLSELFSKIYFEGYGRASAWEAHDLDDLGDYWQIRPYATPEPATTGAILGAAGLGLWAWRRRKYRRQSRKQCAQRK